MQEKIFHITNGSHLTQYLKQLHFKGTFLTWHEMLCEGPTQTTILSHLFIQQRKEYLQAYYHISEETYEKKNELYKLKEIPKHNCVVLWFEYDLFCHINLLGALKALQEIKCKIPVYLVCSGIIKGEKKLKGLNELTEEQLRNQYTFKLELTKKDKELALKIWNLYASKEHDLLQEYTHTNSSFLYLGACLQAHLKRFPDSRNGLTALQHLALRLITTKTITTQHQLVGMLLKKQEYYGFGDMQLAKIVHTLNPFFETKNNQIQLTEKGKKAVAYKTNYASEVALNNIFGGAQQNSFCYNSAKNKLQKTATMQLPESELILNSDGSIYHLNLKPKHIANTIIFVGDPDRVEKVTTYFDSIEYSIQKREFKTQTGYYKGKRLTVLSTGIGTDNIDIVLNELDALVNIDLPSRTIKKELTKLTIIRIGTSGTIQNEIPLDATLISSHALDLTGLLHSYTITAIRNTELENAFIQQTQWNTENAKPVLVENCKQLQEHFIEPNIYKGITATSGGFYAPQGRVLRLPLQEKNVHQKITTFNYNALKITNFEMETAGIYGLAKLLGHRAISLNAILANRKNGTFSKQPDATIDKLIRFTLNKIITLNE